ncbi:NADH-quinone oxidoreductase subunit C [Candidatus Methanomassiliicoccus intestinalis]|uniref:NADH-quinone oxidoreductase subunit C n=1 Tax=Candidatus Methanomassiliicoccus intestinalis TaxID=1406512 RepID=UPI0037DCC8A3
MKDAIYTIQNFIQIDTSELLQKIRELNSEGYRLGQICGTPKGDEMELLYSLDKDLSLQNLKSTVSYEASIPSITEIYWPAFIYENEIHDLFGINFTDSKLDYHGNFFKLSKPTPWKQQAESEKEDA